MNNKLLSIIGLCKKSGNLSLGFDSCLEAVNQKSSNLILVTKDLSERTLNKLQTQFKNNVPIYSIDYSMEDIRQILGKTSGIISINNNGFSEKIKQLLNT